MRADLGVAVVCSALVSFAHAACEDWCRWPCIELNGPLDIECADCSRETGYTCFPGAPDFETFPERMAARRNQQVAVGANGAASEMDLDAPIELTEKSMVMRDKYFNIVTSKRTAELLENPAYAEFLDEPFAAPEESPRHCEVHSCVLVPGDEACAEGHADCAGPRGHLRPFGEQVEKLGSIIEYDARTEPLDAPTFWRKHIASYEPVVVRGGAAAVTDLDGWSDEALMAPFENDHPKCALEDGRPWTVVVEQNNRISHNDRWPLIDGWNFCQYLREYRKPDAPVYCITSITDEARLRLPRTIGLPEVLACDDLYNSMHSVRMWMSRGNTTSSQHFDTHDNLMLQIDGTKDIYLSHPNESAAMYMDHFEKYGLSPINVDRVDLQRFPRFANASIQHVRLTPGDALYIPDGYWHVIHSHGRNIALAFEFGPERRWSMPWTADLIAFEKHPGTYWAEQRRLTATIKEAGGRAMADSPTSSQQCVQPLSPMPRSLAEYKGWRHG